MNHQKHYEALVAKARARGRPDGYVERHHVVPRSLGGSDEPENIIALTAREHYVAHILLAHIHGGSQWYAVQRLANQKRRQFNSRLYETLRSRIKPSEEHRAAISKALRGNKHTLGKTLSEGTKTKMSIAHTGERHHYFGKQRDTETRAKISAKLAGVKRAPRSEETKARIRAGVLAANARKKGINPNPNQ